MFEIAGRVESGTPTQQRYLKSPPYGNIQFFDTKIFTKRLRLGTAGYSSSNSGMNLALFKRFHRFRSGVPGADLIPGFPDRPAFVHFSEIYVVKFCIKL